MSMVKRRKCQTSTVCGGYGRADEWFWVIGFEPHFEDKHRPKPDKLAVLVCGACKERIMLKYELKKAQGDYGVSK